MKRNLPTDDFSELEEKLQQLDSQIPVPFAATAQGLKARLSSPVATHRKMGGKIAWSLASVAVVAVIGAALMPRLLPAMDLANTMAPSSTAAVAAPAETAPQAAAGVTDDAAPAENTVFDLGKTEPEADVESKTAGAGETDGIDGATGMAGEDAAYPAGRSMFYKTDSYEDIQLALSSIAARPESQNENNTLMEEGFLEGADCSVSLSTGERQYTLSCTPEGEAVLTIRSMPDETLLSRTDIVCVRGNLFLQEEMLVVAGASPNGAMLQFFDVTDPAAPVWRRTLVQQGVYLDAWLDDDALVLSSIYQVENISDFIPSVYDSVSEKSALLSADQIVVYSQLTDPSYAVVTSVPLQLEGPYASLAVLGGNDVSYSGGQLVVSTVSQEAAYSIGADALPTE